MNIYVKAALNTLGFFAIIGSGMGVLIFLFSTFGWWTLAILGGIGIVALVYSGMLHDARIEAQKKPPTKPGRETDY